MKRRQSQRGGLEQMPAGIKDCKARRRLGAEGKSSGNGNSSNKSVLEEWDRRRNLVGNKHCPARGRQSEAGGEKFYQGPTQAKYITPTYDIYSFILQTLGGLFGLNNQDDIVSNPNNSIC